LIILGKEVCMRWKEFLKDYLSFSKKDRIGVLFLVTLIVFIYLLPRFFPAKSPALLKPDPALVAALDSSSVITAADGETEPLKEQNHGSYKPYNSERFRFDPNNLPAEGWMRMGLSQKTAKTIQNYLSKGGHFNKPEDLGKIWGLPPGFYESVKTFITIETATQKITQKFTYPAYEKKQRIPVAVNINQDDSSAFEALPGIGPKLAGRIAGFRQKLGGFYAVDQIGETYGLPDSTFQKIRSSLNISGEVKKIDLNAATKDQLKNHPYIRWKLANAIFEYRNQHGNFKSLEDLRKIVLIDDVVFEKIRHYLVVNGEW
jgi:competence protein ComEA